MLPLTLLLVLMGLFWMVCLLGAVDFDVFTFDDAGGGFDSGDAPGMASGSSRWLIRYLNGDVVPLAAILSLLLIYQWCAVMLGHHFQPPGDFAGIAVLYGIGIVPALVCTKLTGKLLRPLFAGLQGKDGEAAPIVGRLGRVRSGICDERSGQVEVDAPEHPLLINARVAQGAPPISRGSRVVVVSHQSQPDIYFVNLHTEQP
ncbi:MAG: hypothetical protein ACRCXD_17470 [Luteolibacter sp.]